MNTLELEIVTPLGLIFAGRVRSATFPGSEGEFGILPGHASLMSELRAGVIEVELENGNKEAIAINWGYVKIDEEKTTILADGAVAISGSSDSEIAASMENARQLIQSMGDNDIAMAKVNSLSRKL